MKIINVLFALIIAVGLFLPFNYPVKADTQMFGSSTAGDTVFGKDTINYQQYTATTSGIVTYIRVRVVANSNIRVGLYSDSGNLPNVLLGSSASTAVVSGDWRSVYLTSSVGVNSGIKYWIAALCQTNGGVSYSVGSSLPVGYVQSMAYGVLPNPAVPSGGPFTTINYASQAWGGSSPTVTTQAVSSITSTTATGNGNVTSDGGSTITERGTVYSLSSNPTTADTKDTAAGTTGAYTTSIDTLSSSTTYHVRAYAINAIGTSYGADVSFTTLGVPTVDTSASSSVLSLSATLNGNISNSGGATITNYGFVWDTTSRGDPGNTAPAASAYSTNWAIGAGTYSTGLISNATGNTLTKGLTYYYRAAAYNSAGWAYGSEVSFTTLAPTVTTQAASAITPTTATGNGNITSNGGEVITEKGICYKAGSSGDPTTADSTSHDHVDTTGAYTAAIAGLTKGTAYRLRAYIISASGTVYGTTVDLVTINDPTITTQAASLISTTTARFNSQVTFDGATGGGKACTVTFVYKAGSPFANYAAILAAGGTEVVAAGTYTVGQFPNYDVVGLTAGTLYSFAVKIANSTATDAYGSVLTFTTSTGISDSASLTAIPTATTVSLAWVKGIGSGYTLVRYSASAYPATTADGTLAYLGVGNSYMLTGLTPGTSYYFSAWGKTGALYSSGYVTAMATTLAFDTAVSMGTIEAPPSNSWWNQTPSTTKVSNIPLVSGLVSANAAAYSIPESSLWYFLWILFSVGIGVFIYSKSGNNLPMSLGAQALLFALGAVLGLVMLWIMVLFMIIGAGFSLWGDRR